MIYTFLKPKTTNIWKGTWENVKVKWQFWVPFAFVFIFGPIVLFIPFIYFIFIQNKIRSSFWKEFAEANGWQFRNIVQPEAFGLTGGKNPNNESGIMFREGHTRYVSNEIEGTLNKRSFRIFCYQFSIGYGKSKKTYYYTVFAFRLDGSFPHLYLNNKSNTWSIDIGEKIPLPDEFEDKFSLMAPKEYEIEALEIFTPDILTSLLDRTFPYDIEFVNQEILVFTDGQINNFEQLEKRFNKALEIKDLLSEKLDKFKFEKIGDMPSLLK